MKKAKLIISLVSTLILFEGCSTIKRFLPQRKSNDDISYELIENLSTAFSEGKLQALEEMIAIYNDTNQPYDVRMAAGVALAIAVAVAVAVVVAVVILLPLRLNKLAPPKRI